MSKLSPLNFSIEKLEHPPLRTVAQRKQLKQYLPELLWTEKLIRQNNSVLVSRVEDNVRWKEESLPIYSLTLGSKDPQANTIFITGGVHGVERIGTQVVLAWLQSLLERLRWDTHLQQLFENVQLVLMPLINPVGMYGNNRCNGNGVDLNRNSPVEAQGEVPMLGGGHRIGPWLPWYRGRLNENMEIESQALVRVFRRQVMGRPTSICLDLHSGFGFRDRLWFPYAYKKEAPPNIADYVALKLLWERCFPHHNYVFEPQSIHYCTHGDLWDHMIQMAKNGELCDVMPLTLEMGSWTWVKKQPRQVLKFTGLFNPQAPHRQARVLRRHIVLLDFLCKAVLNQKSWRPEGELVGHLSQVADGQWYRPRP